MCGITGLSFNISELKHNKEKTLNSIKKLFTDLLLSIEPRGRRATGAALMTLDGKIVVAKDKLRAADWVKTEQYQKFIDEIDHTVVGIIGLVIAGFLAAVNRWYNQVEEARKRMDTTIEHMNAMFKEYVGNCLATQ